MVNEVTRLAEVTAVGAQGQANSRQYFKRKKSLKKILLVKEDCVNNKNKQFIN
jgi:hypothetical protein